MPLDHVRTMYQNQNAAKKFFSTEKAGFSTGAEVMVTMVTDLLTVGAMTINGIKFYDKVGNKEVTTTFWPPQIRQYILGDAGSGYNVGDKLLLANGGINSAPYTATVTTINTRGGITKLTTNYDPYPEYTDVTVVTQPTPLIYSARHNDASADWTSANLIGSSAHFTTFMPVVNIDGNGAGPVPANPPTATSSSSATINANIATLKVQWGTDGRGGTAGSLLPTNSILSLRGGSDSSISTLKVGQRILLEDPSLGTPNLSTTVVTITRINTVSLIYNYTSTCLNRTSFGCQQYGVSFLKRDYLQIGLSQAVTLPGNTVILCAGTGATLYNNTAVTAESFTTVLNSTGAIDPLSDKLGVLGNVVTATTDSNIVSLNTLTVDSGGGIINYAPQIYVGQKVTNFNAVGSGVVGTVTVANVNALTSSTATITLSSNQTLSSGKTLRFKFDPAQDWSLAIQVQEPQKVCVYAGTEVQFTSDGNIPTLHNQASTTVTDLPGLMGIPLTGTYLGRSNSGPADGNVHQGFINRKNRVQNSPGAVPLNSQLTVTDRGIFFGVWEGNFSVLQKPKVDMQPTDNVFNWFLIQRPVDRITGRVLTTGRAPVFCINSVGYKYHKFIVRESDIMHPSQGPEKDTLVDDGIQFNYRTPADSHSSDSFALLNTSNQIALTEDSKFLISFIQNLTTPRFRYSEELDMIGQTSADVCMNGNDLSITAYQESGPRLYKGLPSNKPYNTGLRIVVLKDIP